MTCDHGPAPKLEGRAPATSVRSALLRTVRLVVLASLAFVGACDRSGDQVTETLDANAAAALRAEMAPGLPEQLDSAGVAVRAGDYEVALDHYTRATELDGESAAAWYGVFTAHRALGNAEAAEAALERTRSLAPGASIIHPTPEDTTR